MAIHSGASHEPFLFLPQSRGTAVAGMPANYREYLLLLHERGARVYANTTMNVVTGFAGKLLKPYPDYPFIKPATYTEVAELLASADQVFIY